MRQPNSRTMTNDMALGFDLITSFTFYCTAVIISDMDFGSLGSLYMEATGK